MNAVMEKEPKLSLPEQLLKMTRKMFEHASAEDWDELTALERTRLPIFHKVFDGGISENVELAREVLSLDENTKSLAQAAMPAMQQDILKLQKSGQANNAYQTIQNITSKP